MSGAWITDVPQRRPTAERLSSCRHPISGGPITTWYKPGESYPSQFPGIANALEECRADSCGVFLCSVPELLDVFAIPEAEQPHVTHTNWLWAARSGLQALEFYSPETRAWRQAHMRGRYAILQVPLALASP